MPTPGRIGALVLPAIGLLCWGIAPASAAVPHHDHLVVVIMENKSYDEVRTQPYTASLIS